MPHHYWGDESFDWDSLYKAEEELNLIMTKYARLGVHSKEKYGTLRFSIYFCDGNLHSITHPGYVYSQYPKWLWVFDVQYRPLRFVAPVIRFWQKLVLQYAFTVVCAKYPHLIKEILQDAPNGILSPDHEIIRAKQWSRRCDACDQKYTTDNVYCTHCGKAHLR
jgi:hypothetical protein